MKKLRLMLLVLLGVLFAAALAGCGGGGDEYTVTFETNGGTEIAPYTLDEGDTIERPATNPTKALFNFNGWYADEALKESFVFGSKMPAHDVTVYAGWTAQKSARIEYDSMGGSPVAASVGTVGSALHAPEDPTYEGYRFGGWYTEPTCENAFSFTVFPEKSLKLYALWENDPSYAYITYMGNGYRIARIPVKKGTAAAAPALFGEDIVSAGWFTDANLTSRYTFGNVSADLTLYTSYYTKGLEFSETQVSRYTGESGNVIIPDRYNGNQIIAIGDWAFAEQDAVTTVSLPATVARIGKAAFYNCSYLSEINLTSKIAILGENAFFNCGRLVSYGDISGVTAIPDGLFLGCKKLPAITLSSRVTSIGKQAFADCEIITEMAIPDNVTVIADGLFDGCAALKKVALPARLTSFGSNVFTGCGNLSELTLASTNTNFQLTDGSLYSGAQLLYYIGKADVEEFTLPGGISRIAAGAFDGNTTLKSVTVGNSNVSLTCGVFAGMQALETLTVPTLSGANGGYLAYYFGATEKETGARSAYIPETLRKVTILNAPSAIADYAFTGATGLEEIIGLENLTSVGAYAFAYTALRSFTVSSKLGSNSIGDEAFAGCKQFSEFTMEGSSTAYSVYDGCLYNGAGTQLLVVPSAKTSVEFGKNATTIAKHAFSASMIESVTVPETVTYIADGAFNNCASIRSITVPYIGDNAGHEYLGYIFGATLDISEDNSGDEVRKSLSGMNTSSIPRTLEEVTVMGKQYTAVPDAAFAMFVGLNKVNFTASSKITEYGAYSFYQTDIEEMDFDGVTAIGDGAFRQTSLTEISLPATLKSFGYAAFALIPTVEHIVLAEGITEIAPLAFNAYAYNATLSASAEYQTAFRSAIDGEIVIPSTVEKIGTSAFYGIGMNYDMETESNLPNDYYRIRFAEGSRLTEIGANAFAYSALRSIVLPASVETVGADAFSHCDELTDVTFGTQEGGSALNALGAGCFGHCVKLKTLTMYVTAVVPMTIASNRDIFFEAAEGISVYVPEGVVAAFKAANGWQKYASNIHAAGAGQGGTN